MGGAIAWPTAPMQGNLKLLLKSYTVQFKARILLFLAGNKGNFISSNAPAGSGSLGLFAWTLT